MNKQQRTRSLQGRNAFQASLDEAERGSSDRRLPEDRAASLRATGDSIFFMSRTLGDLPDSALNKGDLPQ